MSRTLLKETALNKGALKRLEIMGITTLEQLQKIGSIKAFLKMKKEFEFESIPKCYNYYDLQAIILGRTKGWRSLSDEEKSSLDEELKKFIGSKTFS